MTAQAIGALARLAYVAESSWGVVPGSPSMRLLKAATYGESIGASIAELKSMAINSNRAVEYARGGNIDISGSIPFELPILGIGTLLKHALGTCVDSGGGPYTHIIKRGTLPAGLSIEKGFTDLGEYFTFCGCKIDQLDITVPLNGLVTGKLAIKGKAVSDNGSSLGSPTAVAHTPYAQQDVVMLEGGGAINLLGLDLSITNALDVVQQIGSRSPAAITEGKGDCTGTVSIMFNSMTVYNKWKAETPTTLEATFTQGAASVDINMTNVRYFDAGPPMIAKDGGVVQSFKFRALYDSATSTDVTVTIINTEATL